jgi:hypothetical protein
LRRSPTVATPISLRSSAGTWRRTFSSMPFSRKTASYLSRPRLRSPPDVHTRAPHGFWR